MVRLEHRIDDLSNRQNEIAKLLSAGADDMDAKLKETERFLLSKLQEVEVN